MAELLKRVEKGAIITADEWNKVVDAVNELLQSGQAVGIRIAGLLPAGTENDPIRIGTLQQISGQNFGYSIGQTTVTFQGPVGPAVVRREDMLLGSSDTRLLFTVPPIPGLPNAGDLLTMRVDNGVAHDVRTVFVEPVVIELEGDVFVERRIDVTPNPDPNPLLPGAPASFFYSVATGTNMPGTFTLSADIPSASTAIPLSLVPSIQFLNPNGSSIAGKQIQMGTNETRNIVVRFPEIPASFANQTFSLRVRAQSGDVVGSDSRSFTVGQAVTPPDPNIEVEETGFRVFNLATGASDDHGGDLVDGTIRLSPNRRMRITYNVTLKAEGSYDLTLQELSGITPDGWILAVMSPPSPIVVNDQNVGEVHTVRIGITRELDDVSSPTEVGTIVMRIHESDAAGDWNKEYDLERQ